MKSSLITFDKLYLHVPFSQKDEAREKGLKFDGDGKCWFLPAGEDPLPFRHWWAYLDDTYEDREFLKKKGCRFNGNLRKWFVPASRDYDDFAKWWAEPLKQFLFCDRRFAVYEHIANSGQADVYMGWDLEGDLGRVAIKVFFKDQAYGSTEAVRKSVNLEIGALQRLENHSNIARFLGWELNEKTERFSIVSRWIPGGNLYQFIGKTEEEAIRSFTSSLVKSGFEIEDEEEFISGILEDDDDEDELDSDIRLMLGVLDGIVFAHGNGILHRDIKPLNVLIDLDEESGELVPVICDFGASKFRNPDDGDFLKRSKNTVVALSTKPYRPQFFHGSPKGEKEIEKQFTWDLFSWSIMTIEILANKNLETREEAMAVLKKELARDLGKEIVQLLQNAAAVSPDRRPDDLAAFKQKLVDALDKRRKSRR